MKLKHLSALLLLLSANTFAATFPLPPENESIIGITQLSTAQKGDNVVNLAVRYNLGYNALENANPHLNMQNAFPAGSPVQIATAHLLPNLPRQGIVVNLAEMRMYYYLTNGHVLTYPIGIGKIGKTIPIVDTATTYKTINPNWIAPKDIRQFDLEQGIVLPRIMSANPDNPLGPFAIYMQLPTYLIHSTIAPESIGKRASFGCIRMYQSDIEEFFPTIERDIPVAIINAPVKTGWQQDRLFIEAYRPLQEHSNEFEGTLPGMVHRVQEAAEAQPTLIDWQALAYVAETRDGVPHEVGVRLPKA